MSMKRQHKELGSLCIYPYNKQNMSKLKVSDFSLSPSAVSRQIPPQNWEQQLHLTVTAKIWLPAAEAVGAISWRNCLNRNFAEL